MTGRRYLSFNLTTFLGQAMLLIAVGAIGTAVALPVNQATQSRGQVDVTLPERQLDVEGALDGGFVLLTEDTPVQLVARDLPAWLAALTEAQAAVTFLSIGLGALLLWRLLRAVANGDPFRPGNARLVSLLAMVVGVGGVLAQVAADWSSTIVREHLGVAGPGSPFIMSFTLPLRPVLFAALLLVVADAVRAGTQLREDVEGLV